MSDGGFTRSFRRKWRNPVFRNFRDGGIWSYLCDNAAWQDTTVRFCERPIDVKRGQIVISERFLAEGFCCDRQVIRRLFDALESAQMITRQKTHGGTIITLCNYEEYQSALKDAQPAENPGQTQGEPKANPNKKEEKEGNEGEEEEAAADATADPPDPREVIFGTYLPWLVQKSGRSERAVRSFLGGCCAKYGDGHLIDALAKIRAGPAKVEPCSAIVDELKRTKRHESPRQTADEKSRRLAAGLGLAELVDDVAPSGAGAGDGGGGGGGDRQGGGVIDASPGQDGGWVVDGDAPALRRTG